MHYPVQAVNFVEIYALQIIVFLEQVLLAPFRVRNVLPLRFDYVAQEFTMAAYLSQLAAQAFYGPIRSLAINHCTEASFAGAASSSNTPMTSPSRIISSVSHATVILLPAVFSYITFCPTCTRTGIVKPL